MKEVMVVVIEVVGVNKIFFCFFVFKGDNFIYMWENFEFVIEMFINMFKEVGLMMIYFLMMNYI